MIPLFCRVYTGDQMWQKVVDAGIEDALGLVRLGSSFELGGFLASDMLKGKWSSEMCLSFGKFEFRAQSGREEAFTRTPRCETMSTALSMRV